MSKCMCVHPTFTGAQVLQMAATVFRSSIFCSRAIFCALLSILSAWIWPEFKWIGSYTLSCSNFFTSYISPGTRLWTSPLSNPISAQYVRYQNYGPRIVSEQSEIILTAAVNSSHLYEKKDFEIKTKRAMHELMFCIIQSFLCNTLPSPTKPGCLSPTMCCKIKSHNKCCSIWIYGQFAPWSCLGGNHIAVKHLLSSRPVQTILFQVYGRLWIKSSRMVTSPMCLPESQNE